MQLVVARVAATEAVVSEATTRTTLEAAKQSAKNCAMTTQSAPATATTERDSLATRLASAEVEIDKLRVAAMLTVSFRQPRVLVIHWFRL
jgi:hypothetical protein